MFFDISLNDLLKSAIYASINGVAMFLSVRYMGRIVDKLERSERRGGKPGNDQKNSDDRTPADKTDKG
jgi:hypothetical protein